MAVFGAVLDAFAMCYRLRCACFALAICCAIATLHLSIKRLVWYNTHKTILEDLPMKLSSYIRYIVSIFVNLFFIFSLYTLVSAAITPVSDRTPQVRDEIIRVLRGKGVNSAAEVTEAHLASIWRLDLAYTGITSLKSGDFSGLTTLKSLTLAHNSISDISVLENLTSLTSLSLANNAISDISALENLTALTFLELANNSVSDISALENLTALTWINLGSNSIRDTSALENLTALETLILSGNPISVYGPLRRLKAKNPNIYISIEILQDLDVGEPRTVRMIYFLPNDLPYSAGAIQKMKDEILAVQAFYAEQMQAHGYGNKTFQFETDNRGNPKVHRVDGQHPFSHYDNTLGNAVFDELRQIFDFDANIYFIVLGADALRQGNGLPAGGVAHDRGKNGGYMLVPNRFGHFTVAHELGHTFGLGHDFRDNSYIMSYGHRQDVSLSACAAEFLSVSPYFNASISIAEASPPTIELISSSTYPIGSKSIPIRLKVKDSEGIHQVQLHAWGSLLECRGLAGEQEAIVEFEYSGPTGLLDFDAGGVDFVSLSDDPSHTIFVEATDVDGNVHIAIFRLGEKSPHHITTLRAHTGPVDTLAFSPNGQTLASASHDRMIKLWDIAAETNIVIFRDVGTIDTVRFSPDGKILASAGQTFKLWDLTKEQEIATFQPEAGTIALSFSPDGKRIASGHQDGAVNLWDLTTRRKIATTVRPQEWILSVAFSPDGKTLAFGEWSGAVRFWDPATNNIKTLRDPVPGNSPVYSVAFSPDGKTLASSDYWGEAMLWDTATRKNTATFMGGSNSVAFSPDGKILATGGSGRVKLWDIATVTNFAVFPHIDSVIDIAFSPDGTLLASGTYQGTVHLWRIPPSSADFSVRVDASDRPPMYWVDDKEGTLHRLVDAEVENLIPDIQNATSLVLNAAEGKIYWTEKTGKRSGRITRANLDGTNVELIKEFIGAVPLTLTLNAAAGKLYLINQWGQIERMNLDGSKFESQLIRGLENPKHLALDVMGGRIYWTEQPNDNTGKVRSANLDGSDIRLVKNLKSAPRGLAFDRVYKKLYLANSRGKIQRMNPNGTNLKAIILRLKELSGVSVDVHAAKLYWTEEGNIRRAALNGKNIEDVVEGLGAPTGIVLGTVPDEVPAAPGSAEKLTDATQLLANYPNPFNPETWIPYRLAKDADVTLHIYAMNGTLVRTLELGHQAAGIYQNRSRAAYWDGKNALGETVASGVYFYTLTAGDFTATRKMLILK